MTKQLRNKTVCPNCGHEFDSTTPFSQWIRKLPYPLNSARFDYQNLDGIWNCYPLNEAWFITIEEKRYGARSDPQSQGDTHNTLKQLLALGSMAEINTAKGRRAYEYRGHYVLSFEKTCPTDSAWVDINGMRYTNPDEAIKKLLSTGKSGAIEVLAGNVVSDVQGYAWLKSLGEKRLPGLIRWIADYLESLFTAKDKAA